MTPARGARGYKASRPARAAEPPKGDGISHDIAYSGMWGAIVTFPKRKPFATNIIVATVKTSLADVLVQKGEGATDIDWERNLVFTCFGCFFLGVVQWWVYVT